MPTTNADKSTGPVQASQGTSLEEAAVRMEALLDPQTEDNENAETTAADAAPANAAGDSGSTDESVAADAQSEETPAPEEQADEAEATDETEEAPTTFDKDHRVTVVIDGKSQVIPLKEAIDGYQRQSDYSRKMEALKTDRQSLETELKA